MLFPVTGLIVKAGREGSPDWRILDPASREPLGEIELPTRKEHAGATITVRGESYDAYLTHLRLRKGDEVIMSAVEAKGVWSRFTVDYMGRQYVADYTRRGWFVWSGMRRVGQFSQRRLRYAGDVPLLLQLFLLWCAIERKHDMDYRQRRFRLGWFCGVYFGDIWLPRVV